MEDKTYSVKLFLNCYDQKCLAQTSWMGVLLLYKDCGTSISLALIYDWRDKYGIYETYYVATAKI